MARRQQAGMQVRYRPWEGEGGDRSLTSVCEEDAQVFFKRPLIVLHSQIGSWKLEGARVGRGKAF